MGKKSFWRLLAKYLDGDITEEERKLFEKRIREDKVGLSYLVELLKAERERPAADGLLRGERLNEKWSRVSARISDHPRDDEARPGPVVHSGGGRRSRKIIFWSKIAAVFLILLCLSYYCFYSRLLPGGDGRHVIVVERGHKKHITLPDGTGVWLNAQSKLVYNDGFSRDNREISLEGEALFDVRHDANNPFLVNTGNITIKVLGTVFNVDAYPDDPDIRTTLISGKIQVLLSEDPAKRIVLSPHEKLTVKVTGGRAAKSKKADRISKETKLQVIPKSNILEYQVQRIPVNPSDSISYTETAWVRDQLAFVNEPFGDVAKKLERKYDVRVIFEDEGLKDIVMSGIFKKETVQEALHVLQMITRFNYTIDGDRIYIRK